MSSMTELRAHLFDALKGLKEGTIKVEQAQAMNATAQTLINSVKAEIEYLKLPPERTGSGFIANNDGGKTPASIAMRTQNGTQTTEPLAGGSIVTHRIR